MSHMIARSARSKHGRGIWDRRSVFVKATPVPLSFAERRAVLHALKQHCKIDFFQKIKVGGFPGVGFGSDWADIPRTTRHRSCP